MKTYIQLTHRLGVQIARKDWAAPYVGHVQLAAKDRSDLNRTVRFLYVERHMDKRPAPPNLWDPQWLTFGSDRGCMVTGFEEVDGRRYYQGWYICWE